MQLARRIEREWRSLPESRLREIEIDARRSGDYRRVFLALQELKRRTTVGIALAGRLGEC